MFPRAIDAAQTGDEVTVFARREPQAQQLALTVGGVRTVIAPVGVTPVLLGRAVAAAEIAELDHQLAALSGAAADRLRGEIVQRSIAARVVSSQTSMLVLESDADYARYGIDRTALSDILAIGPSGVELLHRAAPPPVQIAAPLPPAEARPLPAKKVAVHDKAPDDREEEKAKATGEPAAVRAAVRQARGDAVEQLGEITHARWIPREVQAELAGKEAAPAPEPAPASTPARPASPRSDTGAGASAGSAAGEIALPRGAAMEGAAMEDARREREPAPAARPVPPAALSPLPSRRPPLGHLRAVAIGRDADGILDPDDVDPRRRRWPGGASSPAGAPRPAGGDRARARGRQRGPRARRRAGLA